MNRTILGLALACVIAIGAVACAPIGHSLVLADSNPAVYRIGISGVS